MSNESKQERTIVQLVLIDETGDSYYRMRWPGRKLAEKVPHWRVLNVDAQAKERHEWGLAADLLVIFQSNDPDLFPIIAERRRQGKKTIVEYNDNFYSPPPASPVADAWNSPLIWQTYEQFIREADLLLVTGPGLNELFEERFTTPRYILPNNLPEPPPSFEEVWEEPEDEIRIGWAGSLGHISDLISVLPVISQLIESNPKFMFHVMGNDAIPGLLNLPEERVRYTPWGGMQDYFEFWKPVHIGIVPLLDTPYNRCRSDIKAIEMSSRGVLPVLPQALPYEQFLKDVRMKGYRKHSELTKKVLSLAKDLKRLTASVKKCHTFVAENRIESLYDDRLILYEELLEEVLPSDYTWPLPTGYHEVKGTTQQHPTHVVLLKNAQDAIKAGNHGLALELLQRGIASNPAIPEVHLALVRLLSQQSHPELQSVLSTAIERFPGDLRFHLYAAQTASEDIDRQERWSLIFEMLSHAPLSARRFFQTDTLRLFCRHAQREESIRRMAPRLHTIYPEAADLRFILAQHYVEVGDHKKAYEHFSWLSEAKDAFTHNKHSLETLKSSYLRAWSEGLLGRVKDR